MLESGKTLSHYRLVEKIGQGGMGEVWKATDVRLGREIALKVLPEQVTRDPSRLDRFAREAKLLASLNHPGIATLHDVDEHEGVRFIVMELVPGDDLSQALARGALPVREALEVALQIARAVEVAHGQGVVHRDLKPANVKRTADGKVKVLDFGLAKAMAPDPSSGDPSVSMSPTVTSAGTVEGVIFGTAAYMSPEQARGRPIDKRTDVWSFGVVLYELLTADNPFRGDTVADSVGAILHRNPDLDALPPATPTSIRRLLKRCLTRDRAQRLHDIADARIELEEAIANPEVETRPTAAPARPAPASKLPWIALAVLVPLVAVLGWLLGSGDEPDAPGETRRFKLVPDAEVTSAIVSPDGTRIAYVVENELLIRSLDSLEPREAGVDVVERAEIFWSPDGRSLGAVKDNEILRIDLDGGAPVVLTDAAGFVDFVTWADDGYIYYAPFQGGISRVPESGGAPEPVLVGHDDLVDYHGVVALPEGRGVLTLPHLQQADARTIFLEVPGEKPEPIFTSDSIIGGLRYSPTGHVLFHRQDNPSGLWALPFSTSTNRTTGDPFLVVPDLTVASFSNAGDMIYTQSALQSGKRRRELVWTDRTGQEVDRLDMALYEAFAPVVSPDGSKVALIAAGVGRPSTDAAGVWVIDLERRTSTRLTTERIIPTRPLWSADGARVAYVEAKPTPEGGKNVVSVRADGTGDRQVLFTAEFQFFLELSRDWSIAAFMRGTLSGENGMSIVTLRPGDPSSLETFVDGPRHDVAPVIHPHGSWVAYMVGDIPNLDVVVRPFPEGEGQWKVSRGPAGFASWSADGKKLYYTDGEPNGGGHMIEVTFDGSGPTPVFGTPTRLFAYPGREPRVTPDGRFVRVEDKEPAEGEEVPDVNGIVFVENWIGRFAQSR
jgi:serine/threonine-protein kinase